MLHTLPASPAMALDEILFPLVIEGQREWREARFIRVDPRPVRPDAGVVELEPDSFRDVDPSAIDVRRGLMRRVGAEAADILEHAGCHGPMTNPERRRLPDCPDEQLLYLAVSLPREGGASRAYPRGDRMVTHPHGGSVPAGAYTVRLLKLTAGPTGAVYAVWDYVFAPTEDGWTLHERVNLFLRE